jgi:hypothetical protein
MATLSSSAPSGLPSGISAPLETITQNDKGGLIAILAGFALSLVLVSFPIRAYARNKIGQYKVDDYAFLAATVRSLVVEWNIHSSLTGIDVLRPSPLFKRLRYFMSWERAWVSPRTWCNPTTYYRCNRFVEQADSVTLDETILINLAIGCIRQRYPLHHCNILFKMLDCFPVPALDTRARTLPGDMGHDLNVHSMGSSVDFPGCITLPSSSPVD